MRVVGPKITANNDKISIAFDQKMRLGPLHTLIEGYLQLSKDQQKAVDELIESFLEESEGKEEYSRGTAPQIPVLTLKDLKTKKEIILNIVNNRANPNFLTAREIQELYQHYMKEKIGISTIQTNLNRLVDSGHVERQEGVNPIEYRINPKKVNEIPKILM
jgi:hypothetical protein